MPTEKAKEAHVKGLKESEPMHVVPKIKQSIPVPPSDKSQRHILRTIAMYGIFIGILAISISGLAYLLEAPVSPIAPENFDNSTTDTGSADIPKSEESSSSSSVVTQKSRPTVKHSAATEKKAAATQIPKSSSSASAAVSSSTSRAASSPADTSIKQVPDTRSEQRKLLKAVQDAKRARQSGVGGSAGSEM